MNQLGYIISYLYMVMTTLAACQEHPALLHRVQGRSAVYGRSIRHETYKNNDDIHRLRLAMAFELERRGFTAEQEQQEKSVFYLPLEGRRFITSSPRSRRLNPGTESSSR